MTKLVCGVGITDIKGMNVTKVYRLWVNMLTRCYSEKVQERQPTYKGCSVCSEWLTFSNFKSWFDINYKEGMHLDKDILNRNNKVYCPEFCRFVPQEINLLIIDHAAERGDYPIGVCFEESKQKYRARIRLGTENQKHLGYFNDPISAFNAYKEAKEEFIKLQADKYFDLGLITSEIRDALYAWEVNITD